MSIEEDLDLVRKFVSQTLNVDGRDRYAETMGRLDRIVSYVEGLEGSLREVRAAVAVWADPSVEKGRIIARSVLPRTEGV